jgi:hypothetical protein
MTIRNNLITRIVLLLSAAAVVFFAVPAIASDSSTKEVFPEPIIPFSPKSYICYRTESPITIDGKMSEQSWQKAPWSEYFADIQGPSQPTPRFKTRAKMLWDDNYFYIAAELEEPHVWATLKKRDSVIFYDNDFEVFIDPDGDTHRYYELELNAYSTEWDLLLDRPYRDDGKAFFHWDMSGLKTAVHIDGTINDPSDRDRGWTVEIAIPFAVLLANNQRWKSPKPGQQFRINFSRVEWKTEIKNNRYVKTINPKTGKHYPEDNWIWSPPGIVSMHYPEMWGFVQFSAFPVGKRTEPFKMKPEEYVKWQLRRVYYREHTHYLKNGQYTDDISKLSLGAPSLDGYRWPPEIKHTWDQFEARIRSRDGKETWIIDHHGKVHKKEIRNKK